MRNSGSSNRSDNTDKPSQAPRSEVPEGTARHPKPSESVTSESLSAPAAPIISSRAVHWLTSWWHSPAGIRLFAEQAPNIATEVRRFHGDHLLWLGCHNPSAEIVRRCMIRYRFYAAIPGTCPSADIASFCCDPQDLPVRKASVSAVALHHVLDCVPDPRELIREVARITEPGGRLLICGFNPWGPMGVQSLADRIGRVAGRSGSGIRPIGTSRILDWLALLGFEMTEDVRYAGHVVPARLRWPSTRRWLKSEHLALGASSYMISATKRCGAASPPAWQPGLPERSLSPVAFRSMGKAS